VDDITDSRQTRSLLCDWVEQAYEVEATRTGSNARGTRVCPRKLSDADGPARVPVCRSEPARVTRLIDGEPHSRSLRAHVCSCRATRQRLKRRYQFAE